MSSGRKILKQIVKPIYLHPAIGHFKLSATYSALYINFLTNIYSAMILYTTTIDKHMYAKMGWSTGITIFMILVACSYIALIFMVRKFEMASTMGANMDMQLQYSRKWDKIEQKINNIEKSILKANKNKNRSKRLVLRHKRLYN